MSDSRDERQTRDLAQHKLIERALRDHVDELPASFAAETAAFVESASRASSDRLETWLQRALLGALSVAGLLAFLLIGGPALSFLSTEWVSTIALCLGLSLGLQHLAQRKNATRWD